MELDHLVVAATDLASGVAWCERELGVTPAPGGVHPLMGTHNRLLQISSPRHPRAYLEIIAIDPAAAQPAQPRWFDLDQPALQQALLERGPGLIHWVARVPSLDAALAQMASEGIDAGRPVAASRGAFSWRIALREDGRRLRRENLPTLIEWGAGSDHPSAHLPDVGVQLLSFEARDGISAVLNTPRGERRLALIG